MAELENEEIRTLHLLTLPDVARTEILKYLNLKSLKNLRLINSTAKNWVQNDLKVFAKFNCRISKELRLMEVSNSTVPWSNFTISSNSDKLVQSNKFPKLLENYGEFIKHFCIRSAGLNSENITNFLEHFGPELESLRIQSNASMNSSQKLKITDKNENQNSKNLENLKYFEYTDHCSRTDVTDGVFKAVLGISPNLKEIRISRLFNSANADFQNKRETKHNVLKSVYEPLIEYLQEKRKTSSNSKSNSISAEHLTINLLVTKTITNTNSSQSRPSAVPYLLDLATLLKIAEHCQHIGAKLLNVPSTALPKLNGFANLTSQQVNDLKNVIVSVIILNKKNGLKGIYVPSTIQVDLKLELFSTGGYLSNFDLLGHLKMRSIDVRLLGGFRTFNGLQDFYRNIFHVFRPSVEELKFAWMDAGHFACGLEIVENFPNLKKLELTAWNEGEEDFQILLKELIHLQELSFRNCGNCTDREILGPDFENPLICQLSKLTHLALTETRITDVTFRKAVRYMKLRSFEWRSYCLSMNKVTFENGISSLGSIENGFRDSVEIFKCEVPTGSDSEDFDQLLMHFRNLEISHINNTSF